MHPSYTVGKIFHIICLVHPPWLLQLYPLGRGVVNACLKGAPGLAALVLAGLALGVLQEAARRVACQAAFGTGEIGKMHPKQFKE